MINGKKFAVLSLLICVIMVSFLVNLRMETSGVVFWKDNSNEHIDANPTNANPPINITFRLLAIEQHCGQWPNDEQPVKSAQYLIQNLLLFKNWQNVTWGGFNYTGYIHLLSDTSVAPELQQYYKGQPTNSNVVHEIRNFLGQTLPGEANSRTIRIFYYNGHGGYQEFETEEKSYYYLALEKYSGDRRRRLSDRKLDEHLRTGDLGNSNCVLVILDCCYSGGFINRLRRRGRVILASTMGVHFTTSYSWSEGGSGPPPDYWAWFTGNEDATYADGTNFGPLGIIGAIRPISVARTLDKDGDWWLSAGEIFEFANITTRWYSYHENQTDHGASEANQNMYPQRHYRVWGGDVPVVMYLEAIYYTNGTIAYYTPFSYNGPPVYGHGPGFGPDGIPGHRDWPMFGNLVARTSFTMSCSTLTDDILWTTSLFNPVASSSALVEGMVYVGTLSGTNSHGMYALDIVTGDVVWNFTTEGPISSSPAVMDGKVFFGTDVPGRVYALDACTGLLRWMYELPPGSSVASSPAVTDGMVFITTLAEEGVPFVYALNETFGEQIWNFTTAGPIHSSPAVADGMVFVATLGVGMEGAYIYALNQSTGAWIWERNFPDEMGIISTPAVADNLVFIGTLGGGGGGGAYVYALNEFTGGLAWDFPTGDAVSSSPAVDSAKALVVVGCNDGYVYALNETTGDLEWSYPTGPIDTSSPAISSNGCVYIGSTNNYTYCLNETTGGEVWSYETGGPILSSPALTDGHVLIGSMDGKVYCFGPPFPIHDVAVLNVTISPTTVMAGDQINITYTVTNRGNVAETFNVTIGYNNTEIWGTTLYLQPTTIHVDTITLGLGKNVTTTYFWDTRGIPPENYSISVIAQQLVDEPNTFDNILMDGTITVLGGGAGGGAYVSAKHHLFLLV